MWTPAHCRPSQTPTNLFTQDAILNTPSLNHNISSLSLIIVLELLLIHHTVTSTLGQLALEVILAILTLPL